MGCYDNIVFKCPRCGSEILAQSKGGDCLLRAFPEDAVPPDVASDANRHPIVCHDCNSEWLAVIPDTLHLHLIPKNSPAQARDQLARAEQLIDNILTMGRNAQWEEVDELVEAYRAGKEST